MAVVSQIHAAISGASIIPQTKPYLPPEDIEELLKCYKEILESKILINGRFTKEFENATARHVGVDHAVAVNSCTSALQIALEFVGVKGKKVLVPVNTFIATANAVLFAGGTPVIVDIGENLLMDFEKMKEMVDKDTAAVILVHIAGYIHPQIEEIQNYCRKNDVVLIEDAAHAHGASLGGMQAGAFGLAGAFSYYASKVVATGVGGMLTTNNAELAARARSVRFHGEDRVRGIQDRLGADWLMTEFQAALGLVQVRRLSESIQKRMSIAKRYDDALARLSNVRTFPLPPNSTSGYYKYPVLLESPLNAAHLKLALAEEDIQTGTSYWPTIHLQPAYQWLFGYKEGDFPVAENILKRVITLPLYPDMTQEDVSRVIERFIAFTQ